MGYRLVNGVVQFGHVLSLVLNSAKIWTFCTFGDPAFIS